jgi:hypothetical protein
MRIYYNETYFVERRYEELVRLYPDNEDYKLYFAQSLYKVWLLHRQAAIFAERASAEPSIQHHAEPSVCFSFAPHNVALFPAYPKAMFVCPLCTGWHVPRSNKSCQPCDQARTEQTSQHVISC